MTDPIVKWAGGKRQLLDLILPLVAERLSPGGVYHEPFLGGAAVALALDEGVPVVARDVCADLVETYQAVASSPHRVFVRLSELFATHSQESYYAVRSTVPERAHDRAARFIYLNKTGFNGLYRVNSQGAFNVPIGRRRRPATCPRYGDLVAFSWRARYWALSCGDFEPAVDAAEPGDVIYADPPYHGTFGYSADFSESDQARLAAALRRAARRGVGVVATNSRTPLVRKLYQWADVRTISEGRAVAADASRRGDALCILAVRP